MKNILLIGGSYGIGLAIAQELQNENNIFVASRTNENLVGLNVTHIPFDASIDALDTSKLPAVIDGLVYCPGSINLRPFRGLKPEDSAQMASFLLSEKSSWISGQIFHVDGGMSTLLVNG